MKIIKLTLSNGDFRPCGNFDLIDDPRCENDIQCVNCKEHYHLYPEDHYIEIELTEIDKLLYGINK